MNKRWISNYRSRGGFIKYARRQLRRKFGMNGNKNIENITFKERMMAVCPILYKCFPQNQQMCLLCGAPQKDDQLPHIKCPTPGCVGLFCPQCFADLQNLCTICRSPMEYGDMSDMSEERDSSEDDKPIRVFRRVETTEESTDGELEEITEETTEVETPNIEKRDERMDMKTVEEVSLDTTSESSSTYSESYQDKSPRGFIPVTNKIPTTRDVEAQKIRDDVTIQIFNEPLIDDSGEKSSVSPTSCFVLRAHRKLRSRVKPTCPCRRDSSTSSSTSSGDSDSYCTDSTEEIEEEEILHVEIEENSDKKALLGAGGSKILKRKPGRVQRIVDALQRVSFIRNRETRGTEKRNSSRGDSITQKVIRMLQSRDPISCIPCKRARVKSRSDGEQLLSDSSDDSQPKRRRKIKRSKSHPQGSEKHCCRDIYSMNWDSHRERGGAENQRLQLLNSLENSTKYYEIDETVSSTDAENKQDQEQVGRKKNKKEQVTAKDIYDPLAGLEIYGVKSRPVKTVNKQFRMPEENDKKIDVTQTFDDDQKDIKSSDLEKEEEVITSPDSPTSESPLEFETDTANWRSRQPGRGLYHEYSRRFKKRRKKCKKCKRNKNKNKQIEEKVEQKIESPVVEDTQSPRYHFRPIIFPVPKCFHRAPICPGIGYDVEDWLSLHQDDKVGESSQAQNNEEQFEENLEECSRKATPKIPPPFSTYRNYTIPALRRFLPMYQGPELINELKEHDKRKAWVKKAQAKSVISRGIQHDHGSFPRVSNQFSRGSRIVS